GFRLDQLDRAAGPHRAHPDLVLLQREPAQDVEADPGGHQAPVGAVLVDGVHDEAAERAEMLLGGVPRTPGVRGGPVAPLPCGQVVGVGGVLVHGLPSTALRTGPLPPGAGRSGRAHRWRAGRGGAGGGRGPVATTGILSRAPEAVSAGARVPRLLARPSFTAPPARFRLQGSGGPAPPAPGTRAPGGDPCPRMCRIPAQGRPWCPRCGSTSSSPNCTPGSTLS